MKLMTEELEKEFQNYPLYSQEGMNGEAKVIAKYFNPIGVGTWLITEGQKDENGDWLMFGFCHLGDDVMAEFGYIRLSDLQRVKLPYGFSIKRDLHLEKDCNLIQAMEGSGIEPPEWLIKDYEKRKATDKSEEVKNNKPKGRK